MIKSMTAYGRYSYLSSLGKWAVEIHSVNKKNLDFNVFISKDLLRFDPDIRKKISGFCRRGQVTVKVVLEQNPSNFFSSEQVEYFSCLKKEMEKVCERIGFDPKEITFPFLYEQMKSGSSGSDTVEPESIKKDLFLCVEGALREWIKMKEVEGHALLFAFEKHLEAVTKLLVFIEAKKERMLEKRRRKLLERLEEFKQVGIEDEEKVLREVFFYIEKSDITEEITRLRSHISQFRDLLKSKENGEGKALEFLVQEMAREANTISSKTDDAEAIPLALTIKGEVEKIREQVQNIE